MATSRAPRFIICDDEDDGASRPGCRRHLDRSSCRARPSPPLGHRSRRRLSNRCWRSRAGEPIACLIYTGEVYNFVELRDELRQLGHRFRTRSDTEVVLRGYLAMGRGVAERLNGMFAFAIWDPRSRGAVPHSRPHGRQAALLHADERRGAVRLRAQSDPRPSRRRARVDPMACANLVLAKNSGGARSMPECTRCGRDKSFA